MNRLFEPSVMREMMDALQAENRVCESVDHLETAYESQLVVLIHGLGAPKLAMSALQWRLGKLGYRTKNWGYSSVRNSIEKHADRFAQMLHSAAAMPSITKIHIVAHSMGGIVTRVALLKRDLPKVQRIVMLAPPNHGSHTARLVVPYLGWMSRPLRELSDAPDSFVCRLPDFHSHRHQELGIVEARRDAVVTSQSVRLDGQIDHALVNSRHGTLPWHPLTFQLTRRFLQTGQFHEPEAN